VRVCATTVYVGCVAPLPTSLGFRYLVAGLNTDNINTTMSNEDERTYIEEKFHNVGDLFGLRFSSGIVFLEVTGWTEVKYSPYTGFDPIPPGQGTDYQRLEDDESEDIIYVEQKEKKVIHGAIGHSPPSLRRYTNYPEDENRLRSLQNIGAPSSGDNYGFVDGNDSPFNAPTDFEELYIPPGVHLNFSYFNPTNETKDLKLNMKVREYNVRPLEPGNSADANAIRRIVNPGSPIPIANAGSPDSQARYTIEEHWGVPAISYNQARGIGGD